MRWAELSRRKKLATVLIVLVILTVEVYAHTYVPIHELAVVSANEAKAGQSGPEGSYDFVEGNCRWIVKWVWERPSQSSPHDGYVWAWIYKVSENASVLSSSTSILVSGITGRYGANNSKVFYDLENDVFYGTNRTDLRIDLFFSDSGTYEMTLNLDVTFYQRTPIGILPTGAHTIPINCTFYVSLG